MTISPNIPVIAIDGPSASGKGSVAQRVAAALDFHYLDSGAIYRLLAYAAQLQEVAWSDAERLALIASHMHIKFAGNDVFLNQSLINDQIRSEHMGKGASEVAIHPQVRAALLHCQQQFKQSPGLVADGRDMGSVVFREAGLKIYLTAAVETRAQRRFQQLITRGDHADYAVILADLQQRDLRDQQRPTAPLTQLPDAMLVDTTEMNIQQAVDMIISTYKKTL